MLNVTLINSDLGVPYGVPFKCEPFSLGALATAAAPSVVSGIANVFGGLFGSNKQGQETRENMRLQHKLNKEEMAYSSGLQRSQQEWLMNTQYGKTVAGMKNAGLNPAMANGTTPATPAAGSPSSGSSGPSAGMPDFNLGASVDTYLRAKQVENETKVADSEAKLNEANAEKVGAEKESLDITNKHLEESLIEQIKATKAGRELTEEQKLNVIEERRKVIKELDEIASRIRLNDANEDLAKEQKIQLKKEVAAKVRLMYSQANYHDVMSEVALVNCVVNYVEAKSRLKVNESQIEVNNSQIDLNKTQEQLNKSQEELNRVIKELTEKYGDADRITSLIGNCLGNIAEVAFLGALALPMRGLSAAAKGARTVVKGFPRGFRKN